MKLEQFKQSTVVNLTYHAIILRYATKANHAGRDSKGRIIAVTAFMCTPRFTATPTLEKPKEFTP